MEMAEKVYVFPEPASPFGWDLVNDLSSLPENDDIIIDFLLDRMKKGQIYTWAGTLLIAVNPNDENSPENIYDSMSLKKYINLHDVLSRNVTPHIFAMVARAYYRFIHGLGKICQMIVISGENGTGKTFNTYRALDFLVELNNNESSILNQGEYAHNIVKRITNICPLISAFSTASTEYNEESTRHGQLIKLQYIDGRIIGATIHSFLLERGRVTKGASNFQIFYQMMLGLQDNELQSLGLSRDEEYNILHRKNPLKCERYENDFKETLKAMDALNFTPEQKQNIYQIVGLILHMGNIQFAESNECCTIDRKDERSKVSLRNVCIITGLYEEDIEELFTTTLIMAKSTWRRHTAYRRNLNNINACKNRLYSIVRYLYDRLFHWLVDRINENLSVKEHATKWFGILDIFGFEAFRTNGMEQLCVNYANERLQQYFVEKYVEAEKRNLREEGLIDDQGESTKVIHSYQVRLNVLEGALFSTLNDACQSLVVPETPTIMKQAYEKSRAFGGRFLSETKEGFIIQHYAGPIEYSVKDLLSKNTDKIPAELVTTFGVSRNKFLCLLSNMNGSESYQKDKVFTKNTTLAKLKYNLDALIKELNECDSHYVRCVKPRRSENQAWKRNEFRKQLMCTGIFDVLPLARCKYPIRFSYTEFCTRYSKNFTENSNAKIGCIDILKTSAEIPENSTSVYYGNRFIFLTESIFLQLERLRRKFRSQCANRIKTFWLKHRRRKVIPPFPLSKITHSSLSRAAMNEEKSLPEHVINISEENIPTAKVENISSVLSQHLPSITVSHYISPTKSQHLQTLTNRNKCVEAQSRDNNNPIWAEKVERTKFERAKMRIDIPQTVDINSNENHTPNANVDRFLNNLLTYSDSGSVVHVTNANGIGKRNYYIINDGRHMLFYTNRILSRQRLAAVPIKFHIRLTCLTGSHKLPRSELPFGLQDCL